MRPVPQRITDHDPTRGLYGDCFKCCLASVLELPYEDVPNFFAYPGEDPWPGWDACIEWLDQRGLFLFYQSLRADALDSMLVRRWLNGHHLMFGRAKGLPDSSHCVVALRGREVFNPHPNRSLVFGPYQDYTYGVAVICRG